MMKVLYKKIGLFTTLCYCFGILLVAYLLISIPQDLKNLTLGLPINILDQVNPMFNKLNISIAVVLGLGMTSLVLLLFNEKASSSNQQYYVAGKAKESNLVTDQQAEEHSEGEGNKEIMQKADQVLKESIDAKSAFNKILSTVCKEFEASQGAIYLAGMEDDKRYIELISSFAYPMADSMKIKYEFGEGLVGQSAKENKLFNIDSVPEGYIKIISGLGSASPTNLIIVPFSCEGSVKGVAEIASFKKFTKKEEETMSKIFSKLGQKFMTDSKEALPKQKTTIVQ